MKLSNDELQRVANTHGAECYDRGPRNPNYSPSLLGQQWSLWDEDDPRESGDEWWRRTR